jgi:NAD(P)-dependent dehydrogenase (short-subunit alcohol dehydrogenase family)
MPQTMIVTGASRGIGLEMCRVLATRGDRVIATARATTPALAELASAHGVEVMELEVTDAGSINALAKRLSGRPIDALINNAGVSSTAKSISELTMEELQRVFAINASAPMLVAAVLLPNLRLGARKVVMNISSQLECKLEAIACYKSQFPAEKAHVFPRVRAMAATVGMMAGCEAGEVLASSRIPCTGDLMGLMVR